MIIFFLAKHVRFMYNAAMINVLTDTRIFLNDRLFRRFFFCEFFKNGVVNAEY